MNGLAGIGPVPPLRSHEPPGHAISGAQKPRLRERCAPPPEQPGARGSGREHGDDGAARHGAQDPAPGIVAIAPIGEPAAPGSIIDIYV